MLKGLVEGIGIKFCWLHVQVKPGFVSIMDRVSMQVKGSLVDPL